MATQSLCCLLIFVIAECTECWTPTRAKYLIVFYHLASVSGFSNQLNTCSDSWKKARCSYNCVEGLWRNVNIEAKVTLDLVNRFVLVLHFYPGTYMRKQSQQNSGSFRLFFFLNFLPYCSRIAVTLRFCWRLWLVKNKCVFAVCFPFSLTRMSLDSGHVDLSNLHHSL